MSFPPRPPMIPGMPMPPGMSMPYMGIGGPSIVPSVGIPMGPHIITAPPIPSMTQVQQPQYRHHVQPTSCPRPNYVKRVNDPMGPPVTVFVGNITERAPENMVRQILSYCGPVLNWKRVQGASGRLQAFGFCEYGNPDAGLRAVRLLHDLPISDKNLVVKVDAKTQTVLDAYKAERRKKLKSAGDKSPLQDEKTEEEEDYMDDDMKTDDLHARELITAILKDYEMEMKNYVPPPNRHEYNVPDKERKMSKTQEKLMQLSHAGEVTNRESGLNLEGVDIEDGKKELISREIGKFRENMKRLEEEKEAERRKRELQDRERRDKDVRSRSRSRDGSVRRSRSPTPDYARHRMRNKARDRDFDRERSRTRDNTREREDIPARKSDKEIMLEKEKDEENKERKKMERKAREKEAAYQERLRNWDIRERRKMKEHEKEKERELLKQEDLAREARKLKEFLEDYDDDRDDPKYYKGRELQRRLAEREKEIEQDNKDRQREKEELDSLRSKIFAEGHANPNAEFERAKLQREEMYKPKILLKLEQQQQSTNATKSDTDAEHGNDFVNNVGEKSPLPQQAQSPHEPKKAIMTLMKKPLFEPQSPVTQTSSVVKEDEDISQTSFVSAPSLSPVPIEVEEKTNDSPLHPPDHLEEPLPHSEGSTLFQITQRRPSLSQQTSQSSSTQASKRKKLDVKEVFNTDDDEDSLGAPKKRKLVPLDYGEDKDKDEKDSSPKKKSKDDKEEVPKSQEEKRKHIKSVIDKIPTERKALFAFQIDWKMVDNVLMEKRIRPWINKKIIEYIGEPELTLVDFICSKVLARSTPQSILDDVQMVLDDEAEVFVVKMWRLLIYEIEAKKLGLMK